MSDFTNRIRPHVERELDMARSAERSGDAVTAFRHLERAHVLGQSSTRLHARVHWHMLRWGLRQRQLAEVAGQVLRLVGATTKTAFGLVPAGNTGGSNVSPLRPMAIDPELEALIRQAQR